MTKRSIILLLFYFFTLVNTAWGQYSKWEKNANYHGIEFKKIRYRKDGKESLFVNGILKQKTVIDGYPCHKNVTLTKDGRLKFFILAEDFEVAGNLFKKETQVIIRSNDDFLIYTLYKPVVKGYHIKKTNYKKLFFMGSTNFQLYPKGELKFFQPAEDIEIEGIRCKPSAVRGGIHLYENGRLKECTSAKDQVIQGKQVGKNFNLKFNQEGNLTYAKKEKVFGK